jgi:ribonucleoside-diphosphate reductase alpha chain
MPNKTSTKNPGLKFQRQFTNDNVNVVEMFEYDYRTSVIRNPTGEVVFEMTNVEVPKQWSQIATDILAQKYFRKAGVPQPDGSLGRETSAKQVAHRMANCWRCGESVMDILLLHRMPKFSTKSWCIVF